MTNKKDLFVQKIQKIFGPKHVRVLQHLYEKPPVTFRVNTLKMSPSDALKMLKQSGFTVKPGPLSNSYVIEHEPIGYALSETPLFTDGNIYIQRLASMVPVQLLEPQEGERILDMCAGVGSKTTQIAALTKGKSQIIAVENNKERASALEDNLVRNGAQAEVVYASGVGLEKKFKLFNEYFDRVLLDAPSSNEGHVYINDPASLEKWSPSLPAKCAKEQKKLVASAIKMLRSEGIFVYSTSTFSKEENEDIIVWILDHYKNISLLEIKKQIPDGLFTGFFAAKFVKLQ